MIALVIDPGTSTGYSLIEVDDNGEWANIYHDDYLQIDTSSEYQGDHCIDLINQLQEIIDENKVDKICVEDFFFTKRKATGCNVNSAFRTAIHILARNNDIPYHIINISAWKTYIAGRSNPTKEQKRKWGKSLANKFFIQEALWKRFKFKFPNHSISKNTGKPIAFRLDQVDVTGMAVYYCGIIEGVSRKNITRSTFIPENHVFKKEPKKTFKYK
jgi:Holliday junction resolvasome RuvABC endonuclease subunit